MSLHRVVAVAASVSLLAACGPSEEFYDPHEATADYQRQQSDIVGGTVANGDPAVVALAIGYSKWSGEYQYAEFCTGTLIAPRTVLSAAHCYYPYGTSYEYFAVFGTSVSSPTSAVKIASWERNPNYDPQQVTAADISVIQLTTPVTNVTPIALNTTPPDSSWVGRTIRHVGFGNTVGGSTPRGSGTKREVSFAIREVYPEVIESGTTGKQTCTGDSGGPGFVRLSTESAEVVAGVVSFGDPYCTDEGYDANVATYASWILSTMAAWEVPTCAEDGQCKQGCSPVDVDCVCKQDGTCNPQCPNLDKDPDCPKNCGNDGICAQGACPSADVDCLAEGETCTDKLQCVWRACIGDPQHTETYCSRPCSADAGCPSGMVCSDRYCRFPQRPSANILEPCTEDTFCTEGVCTGPSADELLCQIPCSGPGTCPGTTQTCVQGVNGAFWCAEAGTPGDVTLPKAQLQGKVASTGCSTTAGGPWWWAIVALAGLMLRGRRLRRAVALGAVGVVAISGCGPTGGLETESELGSEAKAIVGGTNDWGDPEVFMLMSHYNNGSGSGCTATLIGQKTLVTAAHCVDPRMGGQGATSVRIWAVNRSWAYSADQSEWIELDQTATKIHPRWNPFLSLDNDIAVARLTRAPGIPPKPWNTATMTGTQGKMLRVVGYGIISNDAADQNSSGQKRQVNLPIDAVDSEHLYLGDHTGKGVCHGDSGGPSFMTFDDGVERLVGIHSYDANGECTYGADIRIDAFEDFVKQWVTAWEVPTCNEDGMCKATGCSTIDVDCYCVEDGTCNPQCRNPADDPDCPADCGEDGVCSAAACPVPDVDCVPVGERCLYESECASRLCMSDPQHEFYCSRACTTSSECPDGMECAPGANVCRFIQRPEASFGEACTPGETFCRNRTVCAGPSSEATHCEDRCKAQNDCPVDMACVPSFDGSVSYCNVVQKDPVVVPLARVEQPKAGGCSAVGGGMPVSALALAIAGLVRRRRR